MLLVLLLVSLLVVIVLCNVLCNVLLLFLPLPHRPSQFIIITITITITIATTVAKVTFALHFKSIQRVRDMRPKSVHHY
jgi:hypothetical protein